MSKTNCTDHPDHDVGEASDPDGSCEEGDHEPFLPAALGTVGHGKEQKQGQRPHGEPLQLVTHSNWRKKRDTERNDDDNDDELTDSTNNKHLLSSVLYLEF